MKNNDNAIIEGTTSLLNQLDNPAVPVYEEDYLRNSVISFLTNRLNKLKKLEENDTTISDAVKQELLTNIREHRLETSELLQIEAMENDKRQQSIRLKIAETDSILALFKATNQTASPLIQPKVATTDNQNSILSSLPPNQVQLIQQLIAMSNAKKASDADIID